MRAILIDPYDQTVTEIEIAGNNLREIYKILDVDTIDAVRFSNGDVIYVDDEGLLKRPTHFFMLEGLMGNPVAGRGLLVGTTDDGSDKDPLYPAGFVESSTKFYTLLATMTGNKFFEIPPHEKGKVQ